MAEKLSASLRSLTLQDNEESRDVCPYCFCDDDTRLHKVRDDDGDILLTECLECNEMFGADDTTEHEVIRRSLEEHNVINSSIQCPCGNNNLDRFTKAPPTPEKVTLANQNLYSCDDCRSIFDIDINFYYHDNGDPVSFDRLPGDSEDLQSNCNLDSSNREEDYMNGYYEPEKESSAHFDPNDYILQCQKCGNFEPECLNFDQLSEKGEVTCHNCDNIIAVPYQQELSQEFHGLDDSQACTDCKKSKPVRPLGRTIVNNIEELKPGDIICWHRWYMVYHYAVVERADITNNKFHVIEYTGGIHKIDGHLASVRRSSCSMDAHGLSLFRVDYKVEDCFSASETLKRARSRLGEHMYGPLGNNCEHFVTWCKTGIEHCSQTGTLLNRVGRSVVTGGSKLVEELGIAGALASRAPGITFKQGCAVAREVGKKQANLVCGAASKVARNLKGGALALNVGINIAIEGGIFAYQTVKDYRKYKAGNIKWEDFSRELKKRAGESVGGAVGGTIGGICGQAFIPVPVVGGIVGGTLGSLIGRAVGTLLMWTYFYCRQKWKKTPISVDNSEKENARKVEHCENLVNYSTFSEPRDSANQMQTTCGIDLRSNKSLSGTNENFREYEEFQKSEYYPGNERHQSFKDTQEGPKDEEQYQTETVNQADFDVLQCYIECDICQNSNNDLFDIVFRNAKVQVRCFKCDNFLYIPEPKEYENEH